MFALWLDAPCPCRFIVENQGNIALCGGRPVDIADHLCHGARFGKGFGMAAVRAQQPGMHLFLRKGQLPPSEIADRLGAMGKGLQRPERDHPVARGDIVRRPVDGSGLLFHDPPAAVRCGAVQVMMKSLKIRIATAGKLQPVILWKQVAHLVKKAERVGIP